MKISLFKGDITKVSADAIVNAANTSLLGGGGVDGAIHRAAGPQLLEECRTIGGCPVGDERITKGYNLPARYFMHTVGPVWNGGSYGEPDKLASCYRNSLLLANKHRIRTIAFPGISTGVYGYPKDKAAAIAVREVQQFAEKYDLPEEVIFVAFDDESYRIYEQLLQQRL